jgi:hypothetical protein
MKAPARSIIFAVALSATALAGSATLAQDAAPAADAAAATVADAAPAAAPAAAAPAETAAPAAAPEAAEATETAEAEANALTRFTGIALSILEPLLLLFATWLAAKGGAYFTKKTKIEIPASIESSIDGWIETGIGLASEKAHQALKNKTKALTGPEKLETAASFVLGMAQSAGWVDWTKETIEKKIESKLGAGRG